jgi:hypothetical protein
VCVCVCVCVQPRVSGEKIATERARIRAFDQHSIPRLGQLAKRVAAARSVLSTGRRRRRRRRHWHTKYKRAHSSDRPAAAAACPARMLTFALFASSRTRATFCTWRLNLDFQIGSTASHDGRRVASIIVCVCVNALGALPLWTRSLAVRRASYLMAAAGRPVAAAMEKMKENRQAHSFGTKAREPLYACACVWCVFWCAAAAAADRRETSLMEEIGRRDQPPRPERQKHCHSRQPPRPPTRHDNVHRDAIVPVQRRAAAAAAAAIRPAPRNEREALRLGAGARTELLAAGPPGGSSQVSPAARAASLNSSNQNDTKIPF